MNNPLCLNQSLRLRILLGLMLTSGLMLACSEKPNTTPPVDSATAMPVMSTDTTNIKFTAAMIDNKKDPSCGMPMSAGIEDTVHYKGKVYGFCSDECKKIFLKDPAAGAKNAELK